ncbi:MAG: subclass B1 metallo-beta-lactamase [Aureispira sp.]|nr:subclass B1 metallo-beta-lactamase [Aureispira sp.]
MRRIYTIAILFFSIGWNCLGQNTNIQAIAEDLELIKVSKNVYQYISYMPIPNYGKFPCNGMIYKVGKEVMIFDAPHSKDLAQALIDWLQKDKKWIIKGVIVNHFHNDCLGGLEAFHSLGIPSYSSKQTQVLAKQDSMPVPEIGYDGEWTILLGNKPIICSFFGEAHSTDNIVSWLPKAKVLFGGCMVKAIGARKGNLADANTEQWAKTVTQVKEKYPKVKWVIPGHGKYGNSTLLDYTIQLFNK